MYPSDIAATLSLSPSTISHQLRILEDAGLVQHVRQGRNRLYSITGRELGRGVGGRGPGDDVRR
jgi:DNA-binding transcriptional ArsR family regulator